jgi:hypothetical protein
MCMKFVLSNLNLIISFVESKHTEFMTSFIVCVTILLHLRQDLIILEIQF